jgi:hypothetical protein
MRVMVKCGAGIDVHKKNVVVNCRRVEGKNIETETRTFGTKTPELLVVLTPKSCTNRVCGELNSSRTWFKIYQGENHDQEISTEVQVPGGTRTIAR